MKQYKCKIKYSEELKKEWELLHSDDFCKKYSIHKRERYKLFGGKERIQRPRLATSIIKEKNKIRELTYRNINNDILKENYKKVMDKFSISESKVKLLLNKYTFSEILLADNINNIKDNILVR